ncbi:MAG: class I SAM-dependent methyltransferase [Chlamydiales bacterium]|nr:class I SAM-dependent methyltransferase [Chlamydiales bacterium]
MKRSKLASLALIFFCASSALHAERTEEEVKQQVCSTLPSLHGWCTVEKAISFIDLVLEVKPEICVEVGVFGGSSIFPVASALQFLGKGVVVAIDPWDKGETIKNMDPEAAAAHVNWWSKVNFDRIYASYLGMVKMFGLEEQCITIRSTSERAAPILNKIDILYLDGNHSEAGFTRDVQLYLPKVRSGGYIWINDTLWTEVQPAIDLLMEECDAVKLIDNGNCILFRKR